MSKAFQDALEKELNKLVEWSDNIKKKDEYIEYRKNTTPLDTRVVKLMTLETEMDNLEKKIKRLWEQKRSKNRAHEKIYNELVKEM